MIKRKKIPLEHFNKYDKDFIQAELEEAIVEALLEKSYDLQGFSLEDRSEIRLKIRSHSYRIYDWLKDVSGELLQKGVEILIQIAISEIEKIINEKTK